MTNLLIVMGGAANHSPGLLRLASYAEWQEVARKPLTKSKKGQKYGKEENDKSNRYSRSIES